MRDRTDHRSDALRPPGPPPELRARTLAAARRAMTQRSSRPDFWVRIWSSRPLRLAWAVTLAGLVLGHVLVGIADRKRPIGSPPATAAASAESELADVVELGRFTVDLPGFEIRITASSARGTAAKEPS